MCMNYFLRSPAFGIEHELYAESSRNFVSRMVHEFFETVVVGRVRAMSYGDLFGSPPRSGGGRPGERSATWRACAARSLTSPFGWLGRFKTMM